MFLVGQGPLKLTEDLGLFLARAYCETIHTIPILKVR